MPPDPINISSFALGGTNVRVDANADGVVHDGTSWCTAFQTLEEGLAAAAQGGVVLIADGTYVPAGDGLDNPRDATFRLQDGVRVKGGYAGCGAEDPDARDPSVYVTVLSGDRLGDDGANFSNIGDNCYHVVTTYRVSAATRLSGVTVTGGNADGRWEQNRHTGGGMLNMLSNVTVRGCTFVANAARGTDGTGAGMANLMSSPTVRACRMTGNYAQNGGAMVNVASSPMVVNCDISSNIAQKHGGAVLCAYSSEPTMERCLFEKNSTGYASKGGAMMIDRSSVRLDSCRVSENYSDGYGGAAYVQEGSIDAEDATIIQNTSRFDGGGIQLWKSQARLTRSAINNNVSGGNGGAVSSFLDCSVTAAACEFDSNIARIGAGIYEPYVLSVSNSLFRNNRNTTNEGGGAIQGRLTQLRVVNSTFIGNEGYRGGAIAAGAHGVEVENCSFFKNRATRGGAIYGDGPMKVSGCTFTGNNAYGLYFSNSTDCSVVNSIHWMNTPASVFGSPMVTYSDIEGGWQGEGNINRDPIFEDAANGDVRLIAGSPCIDAGSNDAVTSEFDLDGNPRFVNGRVDMGPYEYLCGTVTEVTVECTDRGVVATVASTLPQGTVLTLLLDGATPRRVILDVQGLGRARWKSAGGHVRVCVLGCSERCAETDCP